MYIVGEMEQLEHTDNDKPLILSFIGTDTPKRKA